MHQIVQRRSRRAGVPGHHSRAQRPLATQPICMRRRSHSALRAGGSSHAFRCQRPRMRQSRLRGCNAEARRGAAQPASSGLLTRPSRPRAAPLSAPERVERGAHVQVHGHRHVLARRRVVKVNHVAAGRKGATKHPAGGQAGAGGRASASSWQAMRGGTCKAQRPLGCHAAPSCNDSQACRAQPGPRLTLTGPPPRSGPPPSRGGQRAGGSPAG